MAPLVGAVEGGGTKFVCAVGTDADSILRRTVVATGDPVSTLAGVARFLAESERLHGPLSALGVACFGPIELRAAEASYGRLLGTPKAGWSGVDILQPLIAGRRVRVALDTDVAAAALAELRLGAGRSVQSLAYVTVGTGIGVGFAPDPLRSLRFFHPEGGHIPVRRAAGDEAFAGVCPYHGDCLEGLASGPAIAARWGVELSALPADHPGLGIIGFYLGQLAAFIALLTGVERIVFGGGVMQAGSLLARARIAASTCLGGYLPALSSDPALERLMVAPGLADDSGLKGAFLLALDSPAA